MLTMLLISLLVQVRVLLTRNFRYPGCSVLNCVCVACCVLFIITCLLAVTAVIGDASDSEMEEEVSKIELPDTASSHKNPGGQSAVRLCEIGPRMSLKLVKIENGMATGDVLYHAFGT